MRPRVEDLESGQPMANIESSDPGLYFRLDNGTLMKVGPSHVGTTAPNSSPAANGQTGNAEGETWIDTSISGLPLLKVYTGTNWLTVSTKGDEGQKGQKGQKGYKGEDSTVKGPKGPKGLKGLSGSGGKGGGKGDKGFKGETVKGDKGEKGVPGTVPDLSLGDLTDVSVLLPSNRDRLVYNQLGSTWVAEAQFPDPDTGWSSPTGTATKTAFDTASVTTEELAERVKAIIDALSEVDLFTS